MLGLAQTGTGKTAAFALPSLHRLLADPKPRKSASCRMLVLSPTRRTRGIPTAASSSRRSASASAVFSHCRADVSGSCQYSGSTT